MWLSDSRVCCVAITLHNAFFCHVLWARHLPSSELNDRARIPGNRQLSATSGVAVPSVSRDAGPDAIRWFVEFFTANIRNPNTQAAYSRAIRRFCGWAERHTFSLAQAELLCADWAA